MHATEGAADDCDPGNQDKASGRRPLAETLRSALQAVLVQPATHRLPGIRVNVTLVFSSAQASRFPVALKHIPLARPAG